MKHRKHERHHWQNSTNMLLRKKSRPDLTKAVESSEGYQCPPLQCLRDTQSSTSAVRCALCSSALWPRPKGCKVRSASRTDGRLILLVLVALTYLPLLQALAPREPSEIENVNSDCVASHSCHAAQHVSKETRKQNYTGESKVIEDSEVPGCSLRLHVHVKCCCFRRQY